MTHRRELLKILSATGAVGLGAGLSMLSLDSSSASSAAYKALVVIHLNGGNDGNDLLVPTDAAYTDYQKSRPSIALRKDDLVNLSSQFFGHTMGLNRAMSALVPLYNQRKLGFIANAGPLIKPTTASEVLNGTASLPPFLYSHPEQTHLVLGWMGDQDPSGWGGRAIEAMSGNRPMKAPLISIDSGASTLVLGQRSRILNAESNACTTSETVSHGLGDITLATCGAKAGEDRRTSRVEPSATMSPSAKKRTRCASSATNSTS